MLSWYTQFHPEQENVYVLHRQILVFMCIYKIKYEYRTK